MPVYQPGAPPPLPPTYRPPGSGRPTSALKQFFAPIIALLVIGLKFLAPLLKFLPVLLKTGGSMILMVWVYAMRWGWWYAAGFVLLILVHECGHLIAARMNGLKAGAPVFIPFMGAFIALRDAPRNAWVEAQVGIGGPLLGTIGATGCVLLFIATKQPIFMALAYSGFLLNLFNMIPFSPLDGGRIVTAISPWLWVIGVVLMAVLAFASWNPLLIVIFVLALPRLFTLFRRRSDAEQRFFEVTPAQRVVMSLLYFGLIGFLVVGMAVSRITIGS